jgi:hypothetical protein
MFIITVYYSSPELYIHDNKPIPSPETSRTQEAKKEIFFSTRIITSPKLKNNILL